MWNKRYIKTELMKITLQLFLYLMLFSTFFLAFSITNPALLNVSRTAATTMAAFVFVFSVFTVVYGGFEIGVKKKRTVIAGISLATYFTDITTYVLLQIMNVNPNNPDANASLTLFGEDLLILMAVLAGHYLLTHLIVTLAYRFFFKLNKPEKCLIITSSQELANHVLKKVEKHNLRYTISEIVHYECADIKSTILEYGVVFLAGIPDTEEARLESYCYKHNRAIFLMAELEDVIISSSTQNILDDTPFLFIKRMQPTLLQAIGKRTIDIVISTLGIIITSPIMLISAVLIHFSHHGSVFFRQNRATRDGKVFSIIKFRTMFENLKDESKPVSASEDDKRITNLGKVLRKYRVDELPQLFNVLKGEMSIVGPRPEMIENVDKYTREVPEFRYRQHMKAGITGLAQIEGKYNTSPKDKVILDLLYIENFSIPYDFKLMLRTITIFFRRDSTEGFKEDATKENKIKMRTEPRHNT